MPRFSDDKLEGFYQEFVLHQEAFEMHRTEQQQFNTELLASIKENTTAVASLASKTETIMEVWAASQGAFKVMKWVGSAVKWVAGVLIAIGGVWYYFKNGHN